MSATFSKEEFVQKAKLKHGDKYDYSHVNYKNTYTHVNINCKNHGEFKQFPSSHLQGAGCAQCHSDKLRSNIKNIIFRANVIHGNKYDYSKVNYINNRTPVEISCKEHGIFKQSFDNHLKGKGCPSCFGNKKLTTEEFIEKANKIHNNKYAYDLTEYKLSSEKVIIICPNHGEFLQTPNAHLTQKQGCPICKISKGEDFIAIVLKKHNIRFVREYKIPGNNYQFRYDFYLPDHSLLIEFHGGQHFFPVKFFGGIEGFNYIRKNDAFKKELAKLANIPIIYFTYKHLIMNSDTFEKLILNAISKRK